MTRRNNCGDVPPSHTRGLLLAMLAAAALLAAVALAGCGGGDASGAEVNVYVAAPLCGAAKARLASHGSSVGHFTVAVQCLASDEHAGGGTDLAANGANSRRATSDTSAVATLEPPGPGTKFSRPILESAGIPLVTSATAGKGMSRILTAVEEAGDSNVRESVEKSLEPN
jgi:hypothetical protein